MDYLRRKIKYVYEMDPDYDSSDDNESHHAHPLWARNSTFTEPIAPHHFRPPWVSDKIQRKSEKDANKQKRQVNISNNIATCYQSTHQISATSELDLSQFGSEDDDKTWFIELIGGKATGPYKAAKQVYMDHWEGYLKIASPSHRNLKNQSLAEPDLPLTPNPSISATANECGLPGPRSRGDDENSSPIVQYSDPADHVPNSNHHGATLVHSQGTRAHGSETANSENAKLTDNDRKVTPTSTPQEVELPHQNAKKLIVTRSGVKKTPN